MSLRTTTNLCSWLVSLLKPSTRFATLGIGNSGVGKSTLINAVLGEDKAKTSWGKAGTNRLEIYENDQLPFRVIDTIGFEPSFIRQQRAISAVKKWSKDSAKKGDKNSQIDLIWFCVDGIAKRLFDDTIKSLARATSLWKSVPVIVVITKSFSKVDQEQNIQMAREAFAGKRAYEGRLKGVIPVVAEAYPISDETLVPPCGISELIELSNDLMPFGVRAAQSDLSDYMLGRKRAMAQGVIVPATIAGVAVGALPVPMADAVVLAGVETAEVNAIAKVFGIADDDQLKTLVETIVNVGTVSVAAKGAIGMLKAVPGINIAAEVLNAVVAGCIVAAMGEGCAYVFERIYIGERDASDIEWVRKLMEAQLTNKFVEKANTATQALGDKVDAKSIAKAVLAVFAKAEQMPLDDRK